MITQFMGKIVGRPNHFLDQGVAIVLACLVCGDRDGNCSDYRAGAFADCCADADDAIAEFLIIHCELAASDKPQFLDQAGQGGDGFGCAGRIRPAWKSRFPLR